MDRASRIIHHKKYQEYMAKNSLAEETRIYCRHDMIHVLDVARIAYIMVLEKNLPIKKDMIYGAALLHDIGRWKEYEDGQDHALAGVELADEILEGSGYSCEEKSMILEAIRKHRQKGPEDDSLNYILYKSDKASRFCIACKATDSCKRYQDRKNMGIDY